MGSIPGLGRSPGEGKGYPLQYSGPENSLDCIVHGVTESDRTDDFHSDMESMCKTADKFYLGFPGISVSKKLVCNAGDLG